MASGLPPSPSAAAHTMAANCMKLAMTRSRPPGDRPIRMRCDARLASKHTLASGTVAQDACDGHGCFRPGPYEGVGASGTTMRGMGIWALRGQLAHHAVDHSFWRRQFAGLISSGRFCRNTNSSHVHDQAR